MLMPFSARQLRQLASYNPEFSAQVDPEVKKFYNAHPPNSADQRLAYEMGSKKKAGTLLNASQLEESAWSTGSRVMYTPEKVLIEQPSGNLMENLLAVVPNTSSRIVRPGLYQLVAILSTFFKYTGSTKRIDFVTQLATVDEAWGVQSSVLKPSALLQLKNMCTDTVFGSDLWKSYNDQQRSSMTGPRWICFLTALFDTCEWDDYIAFHTFIGYDLIKAYRAQGGAQNRAYIPVLITNREGQQERMVPPTSLIVLTADKERSLHEKAKEGSERVRALMGRDPIIVRGPLRTTHQFVDYHNASFEKAQKAYSHGNTLRGGDDSGINVLSAAVGYSGMPTALARNQILLTSSASWLMTQVKLLDIYCPSIGVIGMLHSSLLAMQQRLSTNCSWRYITSYSDSSKVHADFASYVETSYRSGAHRLWISDKVMPSAKKTADLLLESGHVMKQVSGEGVSFTFFGPIFGSEPWRQGRFVHSFGLPSNFQGFCGTLSTLSLMGITFTEGPGITHVVPLVQMVTDTAWYEMVIKANMHRNVVFLRPSRQYSPISNVIIPPAKGVKFATRGVDLEYAEQGDADDFYEEEDLEDEYIDYVESDHSDVDQEDEGEDDDDEFHETTESGSTTTLTAPPILSDVGLPVSSIPAFKKKVSFDDDVKDERVSVKSSASGPSVSSPSLVPLVAVPFIPPVSIVRVSALRGHGPDAVSPSSASTASTSDIVVSSGGKARSVQKKKVPHVNQSVVVDADLATQEIDDLFPPPKQ